MGHSRSCLARLVRRIAGHVRHTSSCVGFTVIELLVVAGIISVLSIIVIVGQQAFGRGLLLANAASDVALSLRNAQVFGIGSRTVGTVSNAGYGLDFSIASPSSFSFFADTDPLASCGAPNCKPGNGYYTSADALVQLYTLNNGIEVQNFCALVPPAQWYCKQGGAGTIEHLSIVFTRPNTSATIGVGNIGAGFTNILGVPFTKACIALISRELTTRALLVTQVGSVASTPSCP